MISKLISIPVLTLTFFFTKFINEFISSNDALFLFTKAIIESRPIKVFNKGNMIRDFTYIDDIVESLVRVINKPPTINLNFNTDDPNPSTSWAKHKIFNIGNSNPIPLMKFIESIEAALNILEFKLDNNHWPVIKPFLIFLNYIRNDQYTGITMDPEVVNVLRKI